MLITTCTLFNSDYSTINHSHGFAVLLGSIELPNCENYNRLDNLEHIAQNNNTL